MSTPKAPREADEFPRFGLLDSDQQDKLRQLWNGLDPAGRDLFVARNARAGEMARGLLEACGRETSPTGDPDLPDADSALFALEGGATVRG